jgi:hypothetical protein
MSGNRRDFARSSPEVILALLIAFVLAVFKPWGRIRKRPAPGEDAH